jgi:hypothetical protein
MRLGDSLDVVVRMEDPREALAAVFGMPYSNKTQWPPEHETPAHKP